MAVNHAMRIEVEVLRAEHFHDAVIVLVVNEDGTENGFLGVNIVR